MKYTLAFLVFLLFALPASSQVQNADSLINVLNSSKLSNKEQMELCYKITGMYILSDIDKAYEYTERGLKLAEKAEDYVMASKFNAYIGRIYNTKSDYGKALIYWDKALYFAIASKDKEQEATIYSGKAILYARQDKNSVALDNFIKALSIYEATGNKRRSIVILSNMASMYRTMENDEKAISCLEKAKEMAEEIEDDEGRMQIYFELGAIHHRKANTANKQENIKLALNYELEAYEISHKLGNKMFQSSIAQALSSIYADYLNDNSMASKYANESLQIAREFGDPRMIMSALNNVARSDYFQQRYKESEKTALEALKIDSTDINTGSDLLRIIILSNIALGDQEKAQHFFGKYRELVKRHIDQSSREMMADMEVKYETEKKELRIASLEKERQLYIWLAVTGALLVIASGILLRQKIKNEQKKRQLTAANALQEGEIGERERLASELHDRLGGTLSAAKSELNNTKDLVSVNDKLDVCIEEVRRITHNMMPLSLRFGLKAALEDFTAQFSNVNFHFFGEKTTINKRLEFVIYCCASELVTNSIRHSGAEEINVQLVQEENRIALTVQDNGHGFNKETVKKGIGLKNINDRVASCNGKIEIASSINKGTETTIEFRPEKA